MTSRNRGVLLGVVVSLSFPLAARAAGPAPTGPGATKPAGQKSTTPAGKKGAAHRPPPTLSAKQIVDRHLAARGGPQAWRGVQSMAWNGKLEVGYGDSVARSARFASTPPPRRGKGARAAPPAVTAAKAPPGKQVEVPFLLELKRPARSRVEIEFAGKRSVQIFDGTNGWLLRPYLNREDWEPFTKEQARSQQGRWDLDGPLLDHAAKGTTVSLVSVEPVDGRDAYKLKLTHRGGEVQHVWIDAKTFLDVKVEGTPRRMDGKVRDVWVTQRDFRRVQGVMVPFVLETAVDGYPERHRMTIEKVALNPRLDDGRFTKPRT